MLCTTVRDKHYAQQLAGSTTGQMDAYTQTHSDCHLFMQSEVYTLFSSYKWQSKLQADFLHDGKCPEYKQSWWQWCENKAKARPLDKYSTISQGAFLLLDKVSNSAQYSS